MIRQSLAISLLAMPLLVDGAVCQNLTPPDQTRGPFTGFPLGFSTTSAHRAAEPAQPDEANRAAGPHIEGSEPWTTPYVSRGTPNFELVKLFGGVLTPEQIANLEITGHSTGNGMFQGLSAANDGTLEMDNVWLGISVSVTAGSSDAADPLYKSGAHVASYFFLESDWIDHMFAGTHLLDRDPAMFGFEIASPDVDALDYGMGLISMNPRADDAPDPDVFIMARTRYYFSLGKDFTDAYPNLQFGGQDVDPATIYYTDWDTTNETWGPPVIAFSRGDLDLETDPNLEYPASETNPYEFEEIDGFEVNVQSGDLIFSMKKHPHDNNRNQLLFRDAGTGAVGPLRDKTPNGPVTDVTTLLGLSDSDDVDAVCTGDPEFGLLGHSFATPLNDEPPVDFDVIALHEIIAPRPYMGLAGMREVEVDALGYPTDYHWHFSITGWGNTTPDNSTVWLIFFIDNPDSSQPQIHFNALLPLRNYKDDFMRASLSLPAVGPGNPGGWWASDYPKPPGTGPAFQAHGNMTVVAAMLTGLTWTQSTVIRFKL